MYVIIDVGDFTLGEWIDCFKDGSARIPPEKRPTILHTDRAGVEREALRLQQANPSGRFVVFTATDEAAMVDVPTHVNLLGTPVRIERAARLDAIPTGSPAA